MRNVDCIVVATTTVRIDTETHAQLAALSADSGRTLLETVRDAAEALRRHRFGQQVQAELADLARDPAAWADYLSDAEATSVTDGLD